MEEVTLATVLTDIGSVFTSFTGYIADICDVIVSNPLLLVGFATSFVFVIIGLVRRFI